MKSVRICACIGPVGKDPYCACEMIDKGLKGDYEWTEQEIAELHAALSRTFGWEEAKGDS